MTDDITEPMLLNYIEEEFRHSNQSNIQLTSYNYLINYSLQRIIEEEQTITIPLENDMTYKVIFSDVLVQSPTLIEEDRTRRTDLTPAEARLRDLTYDSNVCVNIIEVITQKIDDKDEEIEKRTHNCISIAKIPTMIKSCKCNLYNKSKKEIIESGECKYDEGGYFIIKGKERVLVTQERANYNTIFVYKQKNTSKYIYQAEIRSMSNETGHSVLVKAMIKNNKELYFSLPYITQEIPCGIVFKALGFMTKKDITSLIGSKYNDIIKYIYRSAYQIKTQENALEYIGQYSMHNISKDKKIAYTKQILENELFPHAGIYTTNKERGLFLGYMLYKLIAVYRGDNVADDRDNIANKRFEVSGILIAELFRSLYKRLIRSIIPILTKRQDILITLSRNNSITHGILYCFSTGNWGIKKNAYIRTGVSQILCRLSYSAGISHTRRIIIPIGKEGKNTKIRQLHASQYGFICPTETPEGQSSGIVKNFALTTILSNRIPVIYVKDIIENVKTIIPIYELEFDSISENTYKVFLNGIWLGITNNMLYTIGNLRSLRYNGILHPHISISCDTHIYEINIYTDEGRVLRPLLPIGDDGKIKVTKDDLERYTYKELVEQNKIIYLDSAEIITYVIAMYPHEINEYPQYSFDFCELHPSFVLGIAASTIPYPDHTPSPRNTYQASMAKQAMSIYAMSNEIRTDTVVHLLQYPQIPLVNTHAARCHNMDIMGSGINAIIAICCYTGFNQEDSIIVSKSAIDKGLFRSFLYRSYTASEKKHNTNSFEKIGIPPIDIRKKSYNYQKLDSDGIIFEGKTVNTGDIIIGKMVTTLSKKTNKTTVIDTSIAVKEGEVGIIDKVFMSKTPDGYLMVKVKIRSLRIPEIGDKLASREAQKGIIGMVYSTEDLPFNDEGITPDIIVNTHCIPSRMTINYLLESIGAKSILDDDGFCDCTPFSENSTGIVNKLMEQLQKNGYEKYGRETLYCGFSGELLESQVFMGPVYYQRLKHLVGDKIHARDFGKVQSLTRQPMEGRSREGGLRLGEMERDILIAYGVSRFLNERLFDMSDPYVMHVCKNCGNTSATIDECHVCNHDIIAKKKIPYASKLLIQQLQAMNFKVEIY
jgi:DNA-directed RNA polymerase II subunit RPB2